MTVLFMICVALAADGELERERARVDLAAGQIIEARAHVLNALRDAPDEAETQQLYLDVMLAGGQGPRAFAELAGAEPGVGEGNAAVERVRDAAEAGDVKGAVRAVRALQGEWPLHPEYLQVFWTSDLRGSRVIREQARLIDVVHQGLRQAPDVRLAFRMHRFLISVGADPSPARVVLASLGEDVPTAPPSWTRLERSELARTLAREDQPRIPDGALDERADIALRLSRNLVIEGRADVAVDMWDRFREEEDTLVAALGHASALQALRDYERALKVADRALTLAVVSTDTDVAIADDDALRERLSQAWAARARALAALELTPSALVALRTADLVGGREVDSALKERLLDGSEAEFARLGESYGSRRADGAWAEAQRRAPEDPEGAIASGRDALFLASRTQDPSPDFVRGYGLQAALFQAVFDSEPSSDGAGWAQVAATSAVLLGGGSAAWAVRAELHEAAGEGGAAFRSWASARALLGSEPGAELLEALKRTHDGPGSWTDAADAVATIPLVEETEGRTRVYPEGLFSSRVSDRAPASTQSEGSPPAIGEPMPAWSVSTPTGGVIDSSRMQGRAIVLTFWASYCERCLQMMPEMSEVVRGLRSEGYDVALVAVSVDPEAERFSDVLRRGGRWGALVRDPDLAVSLGVSSLPSTWVVDGRGDVRYFDESWAGARAFGRQLRRILVE